MSNITVIDLSGFQRINADKIIYTVDESLKKQHNWAGFDHLDVKIHALSIERNGDYKYSHWFIYLHADTGHLIQVDLSTLGYRVIYGAFPPTMKVGTSVEKFSLNGQYSVCDIFEYVAVLASLNGDCMLYGPKAYSCQDFVITLAKFFGVSDRALLPYDLRRTVSRCWSPLIIEYNDAQLKKHDRRVLMHWR